MHQNLNPNEIFFSIKEQRNFKQMYACAYTVYKLQVNNNVLICIHSAGKFKVAILIPVDKYKLYYYMYFVFWYQT